MKSRYGFAAALWLLLIVQSAWAVIEIEPLSSPVLEERYRVLLEEMRCPKCQNQNLKDSNAPIAADLRREIRRLLEEGNSDDEVADFLVERYGDFVRYRPALQSNTLVLWLAPAALLLIAGVVLLILVRRQRAVAAEVDTPLSELEKQRLASLLDDRHSNSHHPDSEVQ